MPFAYIDAAFGIILFAFCVTIVTARTTITGSFTAVDFCLLGLGTVFGAIMPFVIGGAGYGSFRGYEFIMSNLDRTHLHTLAAFLASTFILIGWNYARALFPTPKFLFSNTSMQQLIRFSWLSLALSFITWFIYTRDYGGFINYFNYNRLIRAAAISDEERSRFSFLSPFGGFAMLSSYLFWGAILSRRGKFSTWVGFGLSLGASAYILLAYAGRVGMVSFVGVLILTIPVMRNARPQAWIIGFFILCFGGTWLLFTISNLLDLKGAGSLMEFIIREFSFPIVSFFAELQEGFLFYGFRDVLLAPTNFLPSSIVQNWYDTASTLNTIIISGARKGTAGVHGTIPTDIMTFGLMQFHFLGVALYALLFGALLRMFTIASKSFQYNGMVSVFVSYTMVKVAFSMTFSGEPKQIILANFPIFASVIIFVLWRGVKKILIRLG